MIELTYLYEPSSEFFKRLGYFTVHDFFNNQNIQGWFGPRQEVFRWVHMTAKPKQNKLCSIILTKDSDFL